MKRVIVANKQEIQELRKQSALTFEGVIISDEEMEWLENWLKSHKAIIKNVEPISHIITGKLMNKCYHLTETNAYPDDSNIISLTNIKKDVLAIARFEIGGRWLDDIIDNNAVRQRQINQTAKHRKQAELMAKQYLDKNSKQEKFES